jgi:hypothetical protein
MHRVMRVPRRLLPVAVLLSAACTDGLVNPAVTPPGDGGIPGRPVTLEEVVCTGVVASLTVSCGRPAPTGASTTEIKYGGQNVYVKLASSNVAYNSGTGQFTFTVTVQSLIEQPIGTTDGTTLDPGGVRVFFSSGPTVTQGTGAASVLPDGFGTFTAAGQPYYQYNEVLSESAVSAGHTWTLIMPPTVQKFSFVVFISSPVEYPNGYITLDGELPGHNYGPLHPGSTHSLVAVVKSAVGNVMPGVVTFGTGNAQCATVDGAGMVTGVQGANCDINATSGALTGAMNFAVTGTTRSWNGSVSTDWSTPANWDLGLVPIAVDSATIPLGVPNFPALTANSAIGGIDVADGATLSLGGFNFIVNANVATGSTVGSGIVSTTGQLMLAGGSATVHGRIPRALVLGTYSLNGDLDAIATQQVDSGLLKSDSYLLRVVSQ